MRTWWSSWRGSWALTQARWPSRSKRPKTNGNAGQSPLPQGNGCRSCRRLTSVAVDSGLEATARPEARHHHRRGHVRLPRLRRPRRVRPHHHRGQHQRGPRRRSRPGPTPRPAAGHDPGEGSPTHSSCSSNQTGRWPRSPHCSASPAAPSTKPYPSYSRQSRARTVHPPDAGRSADGSRRLSAVARSLRPPVGPG